MDNQLDIRLATLSFKQDPEPHIEIQVEACADCSDHPCVIACPAGNYEWDGERIVHTCEGCLECGTCRIICPQGAVAWRYPLGGYGVRFRWG
jgi:ferredoxin like protein